MLELFPILVSLHLWRKCLKNKKVRFNCGNKAVGQILHSMTSKSERVMCLLRQVTIKCLELNIVVRSSYIEGILNNICDSLSRQSFYRFQDFASKADTDPAQIPEYLNLWNVFEEEPKLSCRTVSPSIQWPCIIMLFLVSMLSYLSMAFLCHTHLGQPDHPLCGMSL